MDDLEAVILSGMKIAKKNPQITAYEALRVVLNYIRDKEKNNV